MPFLGGIGPPELLIFGTIALLLFGKRLPEVARSLGQGLSQFKQGMSGLQEEFRKASEPPPKPAPAKIAPAPVSAAVEQDDTPAFAPPPG